VTLSDVACCGGIHPDIGVHSARICCGAGVLYHGSRRAFARHGAVILAAGAWVVLAVAVAHGFLMLVLVVVLAFFA